MLQTALISGPAGLQILAALGLSGFISVGAGQMVIERVRNRNVAALLGMPVELAYAGLALAVPTSLLLGLAAR